ncbi:MAG: lysoplasmalogenase, partial [Anaerolineales bacterium]|nr:lysoplasmalogenase [Anaerolineales bacterium]
WVTLIIAVINWISISIHLKTCNYISKPATIIALMAWLWQVSGFQGHMIWFAIALIFSLIGDIFLMLPKERFLYGLLAFMLGHLAYIIGLNNTPPPINLASLSISLIVIFTGVAIYRVISSSLREKNLRKYEKPVLVYTIVISIMLISALLTLVRGEWNAYSSLFISFGAILFFLSDTFIAWHKFVTPLKWRNIRVRSTYHLGQIGLIIGAVLHFVY